MIEMNPYYAKTIVPPSKLHFTLSVFNLEDQERFDRMKYDDVILPKHRSELRHISEYFSFYFASNPCKITIQGLNCFREDVLFFSIAPDASLYLNMVIHK